jgi:hypothetical protein
MKPRTPFGFALCGWVALCFCVAVLLGMVWAELDANWNEWGMVAGRGAAALLAGLAAVVAEALFRARPWVWRASLALALAYAATLLAAGSLGDGADLGAALFFLMMSAVVVVPMLAYIRRRAKAMWPNQPPPHSTAPIAVPRPSPPMHPAQRSGPGGGP